MSKKDLTKLSNKDLAKEIVRRWLLTDDDFRWEVDTAFGIQKHRVKICWRTY